MRLGHLLVRQWAMRPGRALATVASVAVAVGAVVATWVAADASRSGYRRLTEAIEGAPSIEITSEEDGRFRIEDLPSLGDIPGMRAIIPLFYRPTLLRVGEKRVREIAMGVDCRTLVAEGLLELTEGEPCIAPDEMVLDAGLASSLKLEVGDEVLLFARRGIKRMQVTGLAESASLATFSAGGGVVVEIAALSDMSSSLGLVDRVRVVLKPDASRPEVLRAVAERLPPSLAAAVPAGRASMAEDVLHAADLGLDFVTGLTVAMSWFIVVNAMLMNVTERRRGLALVRLLGGTARQLRRTVMTEAAILGGLGAVVGAGLGLLAARPIAGGIAAALNAPLTEFTYDPVIVVVAMLMGPAVAMAAAWWPAREAGRVELLEGIAQAPPPPAKGVSLRYLLGAISLWCIAALILLAVLFELVPPRASVPAGTVTMLAFVGITPVVLPWVSSMLVRLVPRRWWIEGRIAHEQIMRQPVRTALTTGVLVVAVSNGIGLGHAIRDNVDNVLGWYDGWMQADWLVVQAGALGAMPPQAGPDAASIDELAREIPGVAKVEAIGVATGRAEGMACVVVARDQPAPGEPLPVQVIGLDETAAREALARGEAFVGTALSQKTGIQPGEEIAVEVYGRTTKVKVAALVVDFMSGGVAVHVSREAGRTLFGLDAIEVLLVTGEPGQAAALQEPLEELAAAHGMLARSFAEMQSMIDRVVQGIVGSLKSILMLGFVVGSLGVANTVTMNVLEKTRTLGLLRSVGMTSGQVTRLVVIQSVLLGAAGGVIGTFGGITTALFIQISSQPLLGYPVQMSLRPGLIALNFGAAILVTAVAAWLPALRASRLDLMQAISAE